MDINFGEKSLLVLLLKNFGWMKRSIIVCMDGNSVRLLIFYITEAITTSTIKFFLSIKTLHTMFKCIEMLHINRKRKVLSFKIVED